MYAVMKHFTLDEFACKHCGENHISLDFASRLDSAREFAGVPFIINSGYRCEEHDKNIGGKGNHPTGMAADILCSSSGDRFRIVQSLLAAGFTRVGIGANFVHVDIVPDKPSKVMWVY